MKMREMKIPEKAPQSGALWLLIVTYAAVGFSIYFSLGEEDGQKWTVRLTPEACEVTPGKQDGADVVLKTSEELFLKLLAGEWKPGLMDFMSGKIKSNDPTRLVVLVECFERG